MKRAREEILKEMKEMKPTIKNLRIAKNSLALFEYGALALSLTMGMKTGSVSPLLLFPICSSGLYGFLLASRYHYLKSKYDELNKQYVLKYLEDSSKRRKGSK